MELKRYLKSWKTKLLLSSCFILFSCADPQIVVKYKYVEIQQPPRPAQLNLQEPYFYVVSPANQAEFLQRIEVENNGVFFALTPGDYEILAENIQEFRRYIKQSKALIKYYENLIKEKDESPES